MTDRKLNIAGKLAEFFITSKLTVLFVLACVLVGVLAITLTPREENPQIIVPAAEDTSATAWLLCRGSGRVGHPSA